MPPRSMMKRVLPRTVVAVGLVSFLNELASQMAAPLIPILMATVLGAGPVALGLVEGAADAVASFLQLWSGRYSDRLGGKRKGLTLAGYGLSTIARPLLGFAINWPIVLVLRSLDRAGKGVRGAPRDALVADATPPEIRGYAYGFQRALDYSGAVGGSLVAAAVLTWSSASIAQVIMYSAIPGALVMLLLAVFLKDTAKPSDAPRNKSMPPLRWGGLSLPVRRFLQVLALFTLASASETFILLRGHELKMSPVQLLLMWALVCFIQSVMSLLGGKLGDKFNKATLVAISWSTFGLSFIVFATVTSTPGLWIAVVIYSLFSGMGEGVERSLISELSSAAQRGTTFGWFHMITGLAAIPAGLLFGIIWQHFGAAFAFATAGTLAIGAAAILAIHLLPLLRRQALP